MSDRAYYAGLVVMGFAFWLLLAAAALAAYNEISRWRRRRARRGMIDFTRRRL